MSINWLILSPPGEDLQIPTYGEYGGPSYSGGELIGPGDTATFTVEPIDPLDELFRQHDIDSIGTSGSLAQAEADLTLIQGILALSDDAVSGEGDLYAGAAILAMIGRISVAGHSELLDQIDLPQAVDQAISLIGQGSLEPEPNEVAGLVAWLEDTGTTLAAVDNLVVAWAGERLLALAETVASGEIPDIGTILADNGLSFDADDVQTLLTQAEDIIADLGTGDGADAVPGDDAVVAWLDDAAQAAQEVDIGALAGKLKLAAHHAERGDFLL